MRHPRGRGALASESRQAAATLRALTWLLAAFWLLIAAAPAGARGEMPLGEIEAGALPREAQETLALIRRGGPFPYQRDGVVFGNRERRLPLRSRGFYREYTVPTPGARDRGARRIVAGGGEYYYSDDHYKSFRRIREP